MLRIPVYPSIDTQNGNERQWQRFQIIVGEINRYYRFGKAKNIYLLVKFVVSDKRARSGARQGHAPSENLWGKNPCEMMHSRVFNGLNLDISNVLLAI